MEGTYPKLDTMTKEDLVAECEHWRALWSWLPENVKYLSNRIGKVVRVITRSNTCRFGTLGAQKWELDEMEVNLTEKQYDQNTGSYYLERKTVLVPAGGIAGMEFIEARDLFEDLETTDLSELSLVVSESEEN